MNVKENIFLFSESDEEFEIELLLINEDWFYM